MATKKPGKGGRASAGRPKTAAHSRATGRQAKAAPQKKAPARAVKTVTAAKRPVPVKRAVSKSTGAAAKRARVAGAESADMMALKARFQRERLGLEKRLTETVREIGVLRHHELRAMQLEGQLKERDDTIGQLQNRLAELERRPAEPVYEREAQQSFALSAPAQDLDEFEDDGPLTDEDEI